MKVSMVEMVKAGSEHLPGILEIWNELMLYHEELDRSFETVDDAIDLYSAFLEKNLENEDFFILAAIDSGSVVGYAVTFINREHRLFKMRPRGEIVDMAVRSGFRGQGTGRLMLSEIRNWFSLRGVNRIELHAAAMNEQGIRFWRKNGFRPLLYRMFVDL